MCFDSFLIYLKVKIFYQTQIHVFFLFNLNVLLNLQNSCNKKVYIEDKLNNRIGLFLIYLCFFLFEE